MRLRPYEPAGDDSERLSAFRYLDRRDTRGDEPVDDNEGRVEVVADLDVEASPPEDEQRFVTHRHARLFVSAISTSTEAPSRAVVDPRPCSVNLRVFEAAGEDVDHLSAFT